MSRARKVRWIEVLVVGIGVTCVVAALVYWLGEDTVRVEVRNASGEAVCEVAAQHAGLRTTASRVEANRAWVFDAALPAEATVTVQYRFCADDGAAGSHRTRARYVTPGVTVGITIPARSSSRRERAP